MSQYGCFMENVKGTQLYEIWGKRGDMELQFDKDCLPCLLLLEAPLVSPLTCNSWPGLDL